MEGSIMELSAYRYSKALEDITASEVHFNKETFMNKKNLTVLIVMTVLSCLNFYGCSKKDAMSESTYDVNNFNDAYISVVGSSVTSESISVTVSYTGINTGLLGKWFIIEICQDNKWYEIPLIIQNYDVDGEAYPIGASSSRTMDYDWQYLYGSLPEGQYRIITRITDFIKAGDFKEYYLAAPFSIN